MREWKANEEVNEGEEEGGFSRSRGRGERIASLRSPLPPVPYLNRRY